MGEERVAATVLMLVSAIFAAPALQAEESSAKIRIHATLYKKHQVCLADVRNTAGRITAIRISPSVSNQQALDQLLLHIYWDGLRTPFIVCSLQELLDLLGPEGIPDNMPKLVFSKGFRVFVECVAGDGATLHGYITYRKIAPPTTSKRVRYDPGLGITTPQFAEAVPVRPVSVRFGRGEAIEIPNAGFESAVLSPWRVLAWPRLWRDDSLQLPLSPRPKLLRVGHNGVQSSG